MATRNLQEARLAFKNKDIELVKRAHNNPTTGEHAEAHQSEGAYIKSAVYGGLDGMITTFSVVMAVEGAELAAIVVVALGVANLIGDGLSMALGDYLSTKAEQGFQKLEREREEWEVKNNPEGEKQEMIELYQEKGMDEEDAKQMVDILAKNEKVWVDVMMVEELGLIADDENPIKNALVTFFSFCFFGSIPILPYIVGLIVGSKDYLFIFSITLTVIALWTLGFLKSKFSAMHWFKSGFETFAVGVIAAGASFLIGLAFNSLVEDEMKDECV